MNAAATLDIAGLHWGDDGCVALSGELYQWAMQFDAHLSAWACTLGAGDYRFPSLIAASKLAPIAYLRSFPHLATFVTSGDRREVSLRALAAEAGTADEIAIREGRFAAIRHLLTPAACYHFYPHFAGLRLAMPLFLTTRCQCFRREEQYLPLQRQWCFEMREIVCIGSKDDIGGFVADCSAKVDALLRTLGLSASWKTASDPFFDPQGDPKALAQIIEPSKEELCTPAGLAIASVNQHRSFFGESYDIRVHERPANSACAAFGIERWLYAMAEVHGADVDDWPQPGTRP